MHTASVRKPTRAEATRAEVVRASGGQTPPTTNHTGQCGPSLAAVEAQVRATHPLLPAPATSATTTSGQLTAESPTSAVSAAEAAVLARPPTPPPADPARTAALMELADALGAISLAADLFAVEVDHVTADVDVMAAAARDLVACRLLLDRAAIRLALPCPLPEYKPRGEARVWRKGEKRDWDDDDDGD